ncbi:MAG: TAT-variant-translocated molybdopterin oxidoreductase [Methylacidiphilales bacterium]|nr:TAT-variant-translocated molybdopterin oxidoreductase [Candidatus Methylacidiphilales bacterium]MDW8349683.1 TAT-variant-translocated molybdopterin oxidoreductase [Verrucomicrobiae bacterium]
MKRITTHPSLPQNLNGRKYWRSLDELADTPEFRSWLQKEFPEGASYLDADGVTRRHFLQLMGASLALAGFGLTSCRRPESYIVPYTRSPEYIIPGKPITYATAIPRRKGAHPIVVTSHEGRPTKIEANTLLKNYKGTDAITQFSILDLYDPDRSRTYIHNQKITDQNSFLEILKQISAQYTPTKGQGLALLIEPTVSPTTQRLLRQFQSQFPQAILATHDPLAPTEPLAAAEVAFGSKIQITPIWEKADIILTVECDFLQGDELSIPAINGFTRRRRQDLPTPHMNRLYAVESRFTITGGAADHRLRLRASQMGAFLLDLAHELHSLGATSLKPLIQNLTRSLSIRTKHHTWVKELALDLWQHRTRSAILTGSLLPAHCHLLAYGINAALNNFGQSIHLHPVPYLLAAPLTTLAQAIHTGSIHTLIIIGTNPAYTAPADLHWPELQKNIPQVIHIGTHYDETAALSHTHAPLTHYLETWGDQRASDGTYLSQQPLTLPLFNAISENQTLAALLGLPHTQGPEHIQDTFKEITNTQKFDTDWKRFVRDGFAQNTAYTPLNLPFNTTSAAAFLQHNPPPVAAADEFEIAFFRCTKLDDGRYANNGWAQELPDAETKLTWDNAALISPATARRLATDRPIKNGDIIRLDLEDRSIEIPLYIAPGHADDCISLTLGYGRTTQAGHVAAGVGTNVYPLRTTTNPYFALGVRITLTGKHYELGQTQTHYNMEGRALVREATLAEYQADPHFVDHLGLDHEMPTLNQPGDKDFPRYPSIYPHPYTTDDPHTGNINKAPHQWGMIIDLSACTGCNACVIACQAENNIPIVGKEQINKGREMHWIRIDRYYGSTEYYHQDLGQAPDDPTMLTQPILCMHCENAPCETVCPVNATVHNDEGLNVMAYNRCIGTRYCANNCPYKVRRFNYFDFNKRNVIARKKIGPIEFSNLYAGPLGTINDDALIAMQKNPNVTVRMRGVMEKCTFCTQRIEEARIQAKIKAGQTPHTQIPTDSFQVACQQACPAEAITFGNLADPQSKIAKLKGHNLEYGLLTYLNTKPRVTYLARIRNTNPRMPDAHRYGLSNIGKHPPQNTETHH